MIYWPSLACRFTASAFIGMMFGDTVRKEGWGDIRLPMLLVVWTAIFLYSTPKPFKSWSDAPKEQP